MRSKITNNILDLLSKNGVFKNDDDKEIIKYGIETFYIIVTKILLLSLITYFLGIVKEFLVFFLTYGIIRSFSFGAHASKSWICNVISIIIFIFVPLLCKHIVMSKILILFIEIVLSVFFILYSPADTSNRPIISKKRRLIYKIVTLCTLFIYVVLGYFIDSNFISNCLFLSIVVQCVMILPITYWILRQPYANYKNYLE